ncbi:hypothetical protein [Elioraea thermophila]|uniref:hypothetical protein n=1 Tax=Elioraea thermophila TaxID=2185104 RepID=UPI000DF3503C|nr:hypothetical protein [Elioraea thermophila]
MGQAVVVHGLDQARAALAAAERLGVMLDLLSGPGAACYAGAGWWQALTGTARAAHPSVAGRDILDCADEAGLALEALRGGIRAVVFEGAEAQAERLAAIARALGAEVLTSRPPALDLGEAGAARRLAAWLAGK